jgi:hypothetical protein
VGKTKVTYRFHSFRSVIFLFSPRRLPGARLHRGKTSKAKDDAHGAGVKEKIASETARNWVVLLPARNEENQPGFTLPTPMLLFF